MNMKMTSGRAAALLVLVVVTGLLGCGTANRTAVAGGQHETKFSQRLKAVKQALHPVNGGLSVQQRADAQHNLVNTLSPQALAALSKLGLSPLAHQASSKRASATLPYNLDATQQYSGANGAGYVGNSSDVTFPGGPDGATLTPSTATYPDDFSYVIYRVDGISQQPTSLAVNMGLSSPNAEFGLALYNFAYGSTGRWEPIWYGPASGSLLLPLDGGRTDYTSNGNSLAFVVFCFHPSSVSFHDFTLDTVTLGASPLSADLTADSTGGNAPLTVNFNASGSTGSAGILGYAFDPEGNGHFVQNGVLPTFQHIYTQPGFYEALVQVTDRTYQTSYASVPIMVFPATGYDEVENNDNIAQANALPQIPFSGFRGSCGTGGAMDGDGLDWYSFSVLPGDTVFFRLNYDQEIDYGQSPPVPRVQLEMQLQDANGNPLAFSDGGPNPLLAYQFDGTETAPYYLIIDEGLGHYSDYLLSGSKKSFNESEPNGNAMFASYMYKLSHDRTDAGFLGSLGSHSGYEAYSGDTADWLYFDGGSGNSLPVGTQVQLDMTYDAGLGNIGYTLYDNSGHPLANSADGDGDEALAYTVQAIDQQPFFIKVQTASGYGDYNISGTLNVPNPGLDEQENNDDASQPDPLGPSYPISGFTAQIGRQGTYDGDATDVFELPAFGASEMVKVTITPDSPNPYFNVTAFDHSGQYLVGFPTTDPSTGSLVLGLLHLNGMTQPLLVSVYELDPQDQTHKVLDTTTYTIDAVKVTSFDEIENDDSTAQASPLPSNFFCAAGAIGLGAPNDGDSTDYLKFNAAQGDQPEVLLWYNQGDATFDFGSDKPRIIDADGDVMATGVDEAQANAPNLCVFDFDNPIGPADHAPFYIYLKLSSGQTKYWLEY